MPIYEYRCRSCGDFEYTQRISEPPLTRCPHCGGKVHRLISQTSFVLKGSGWYVTDYARKGGDGERRRESSAGGDGKGGGSGTEAKSSEKGAPASASPASSDSGSGTSS